MTEKQQQLMDDDGLGEKAQHAETRKVFYVEVGDDQTPEATAELIRAFREKKLSPETE